MDDGEWTKAAELLRPLSRNSAFAPWRLFCKAMDCFCSQNDEGLTEALKRLPESLALRRVVEELKLTSAEPAERRSSLETQEARKILWASGGEANQLAERLTEAVRERQLSELRRIIPLLAEALYPEAPVQATTELLLVLALAVRRGQLAQPLLLKTVKRLLTTETARLVSNKIRLVTQQPAHSEWEVAGFAEYLSLLPQEFSDEQLPLARARVLEFLARSAHSGDACPDCLPPRVVATLASLVKKPSQDRHLIFVDLMQESLEAEPGNWEGHEFLLSLMRHWGVGDNRIVDALKSMATRFPSQPEPCMELARLYYSRNSYRKAERFLEEARGRAPQDESLLDLLAIGYIRSSDQNRIRGRLPRAEKDLWRAEDLQRRRLASVLRVKKLSLQLIASSAAGLEEVKQQLRHLSPLDQLRELGMLILDLRGRQSGSNPRGLNALIPLLNGQTGLADRLTSGEALQLMVPLKSELAPLFSSLDLAPVLSRLWDRILDRARGDDLIGLFDTLLEGGEHLYVRKRVERALKALPKRQTDRVLLLYRATLRYHEGRQRKSRDFREIVETATPSETALLRRCAQQLAQYVDDPLRLALHKFDFELLELPGTRTAADPFGPTSDEWEDELENELEDEYDDLDFNDDFDVFGALEELIDQAGLRGAPVGVVREFAARCERRVATSWI